MHGPKETAAERVREGECQSERERGWGSGRAESNSDCRVICQLKWQHMRLLLQLYPVNIVLNELCTRQDIFKDICVICEYISMNAYEFVYPYVACLAIIEMILSKI